MPCNSTLTGYARDCQPNVGGLRALYIANAGWHGTATNNDVVGLVPEYYDADKYAIAANASGSYTFNSVPSGTTPLPFKKYDLPKAGATLTHAATVDPSTGVQVVESRVTVYLDNLNNARRLEFNRLLGGQFVVVAEDNMGNFVLLGCPLDFSSADYDDLRTSPCEASAGDATSGAQLSEANRAILTLSCFSNIMPPAGSSPDSWVAS